MAEVFKNAKVTGTGASAGDTAYTCPADTTAIVLLAQVANTHASDEVLVDVGWTDSSDSDNLTLLLQQGPIPYGGALHVLGGKLVLEAGDAIVVFGSDFDISISVLEVT